MATNYKDYLKQQMENPAVKAEYDALEPEYTIVRAMIDAREASELTRSELSKRTGITQAGISKLENGSANPSIRTMQRLAAGMGMKLKLTFVPAKR